MGSDPGRVLTLEIGGRDLAVRVVRSARRRRTIAVGVDGGLVVVRAPLRTPYAEIAEIVRQRPGWVLKRLDAELARPARSFVDSETVPYLGRDLALRVLPVAGRRATVVRDCDTVVVRIPEALQGAARADKVKDALSAWYRARAREVFNELVCRWSAASGLVPKSVLVSAARSRWGSCSPDGTIRLNWRLVLGERALAEYVVVHELAHLRHKHHQAAFWQEVARMLPDHRERRRRLQLAGPGLVL